MMWSPLDGIISRYQNFDRNSDGDAALKSLGLLDFEQDRDDPPISAPLVLVLVESRLLAPLAGAADLVPRLQRFKGDLRAEGFFSRFIDADLYQGARHQDGRTLLALRSFLQEVSLTYGRLAGVVLVGSFPEATLVRRVVWVTGFRDVSIGGQLTKGETYLTIWPQDIASRADVVLGDLNGNWQTIYHEEPAQLESIQARPDAATAATAWPVDGSIFSSTSYDRTLVTFRDFFFIQDDDYAVVSADAQRLQLFIRRPLRHPELSAVDRALPNPLARPDILVSRINPRNVAVNPKPSIVGDGGVRPLDAQGHPQAFTSSQNFDTWLGFFQQDPVLERRVLADYFDRNHRFRIGAFADLPFRAAAIAYPLQDFPADPGYLAPASDKFAPPLVQNDATLLDYVRWMRQPAALRLIQTHASAFSSLFGDKYSTADLENEVGGRPFRWRHADNTYTPSLQDQGPDADFYMHRTAWENGILEGSGANLVIHDGCEVIVPSGTQTSKYYEEGYAGWQNGEGLLFYMNGLALVARAKVFNDRPTGFPGAFALTSRARFGDGWRAFYDNDAANASLDTFGNAIQSKKAYFWSMLGDWTVRLAYRGGLGLLGFDPAFTAQTIHADRAWIDGWNFDTTVNGIRGAADLDGDGRAEFVITSDWGIGILKHDGNQWRQVVVAPNDTWFGGWRYNASVNVGKDRHHGVGNFLGGPAHQILLTSSWGIGVLACTGSSLGSPVIQPNGTHFGGWVFDSRANEIVGVGDLNGDGRDEMVVTSDWGIGVLGVSGNTFDSLMLAPNGTRFGGWLFNSRQDTLHALGDFNGDGHDEILVTSDWGIGVLALTGTTLTSIAMHANGTDLDGLVLDTRTSHVVASGDLAGDGRVRIVLADGTGLHVLEWSQGSLHRSVSWPNGSRAGGWMLNTADNRFGATGDLDGDGREEIVVRSGWGLGIVGLQDGTWRCPTLHPHGSHLGDWILQPNDRVVAVGNFAGTTIKEELLIQKGS